MCRSYYHGFFILAIVCLFTFIFIYIFAICNFQSHWARLLWTNNDEGNNLLCLQCYWHLWSTMWYWFHIIFVLLVLHSWHCYSLVSDISCPRHFNSYGCQSIVFPVSGSWHCSSLIKRVPNLADVEHSNAFLKVSTKEGKRKNNWT